MLPHSSAAGPILPGGRSGSPEKGTKRPHSAIGLVPEFQFFAFVVANKIILIRRFPGLWWLRSDEVSQRAKGNDAKHIFPKTFFSTPNLQPRTSVRIRRVSHICIRSWQQPSALMTLAAARPRKHGVTHRI